MKKLLTLMLVLCLASVGSALTVRLSTDGTNESDYLEATAGSSYTIYVVSDSASVNYWTYLEMDLPNDDITVAGGDPESNISISAAAGNIASVKDYSVSSLLDVELAANDSGGAVAAGMHFDIPITLSSSWDGSQIDIWITTPNDMEFPKEHTLHIIPEPMTIALLGLGGLLLRRRK